MAIIYLKATIDKNWHSQSFEFLSSKRVQKKFQKKFFKFFFLHCSYKTVVEKTN